jgi:hypothetical protein
MSAPGPRMKEDVTRVLLSYAMATILLGASLRASASDPRVAKPHTVTRAFFVSGVLTDASVSRIEEDVRKLSGVSSVNGLTSTSGCVRVISDNRTVSDHVIAQTILDAGAHSVALRFQVPEYPQHAERIDTRLARLMRDCSVKIDPIDQTIGTFSLTFLPITIEQGRLSQMGFSGHRLFHSIASPSPEGLGLTLRWVASARASHPAGSPQNRRTPTP